MRIFPFGLLVAALAWLGACAPAAVEAPSQRPPGAEPALWRITDTDSEIWLFGTVHVLPPELEWRGPRFEAAFAAADELVTETDTSEAALAQIQTLTQQHGMLPRGERLSARLTPEQRARFQSTARELGLNPAALEPARPWLAALQLTFAYVSREGHSADAGVENVLVAEAQRAGKRQSYLETADLQIRVLADLPPADENALLISSIAEIEAGDNSLAVMDAAWARGDLAELERLLDEQLAESTPALREAMFYARNRNWADQISERLAGSGRTFIAVGSAHLVGEQNLVALLRERGIAVEGP